MTLKVYKENQTLVFNNTQMSLLLFDIATICRERDNLMIFAKDKLNDEQQRIFVDHFLLSFTNPEDNYPIEGTKAMEWLGFTRKDNFKKFMTKNLSETQYNILIDHLAEKSRGAGHKTEYFKISIEGFKILEMLARTDREKVVRSYYPQLEKIIMDYYISQYNTKINEANDRAEKEKQFAENLKLTLQAERANFAHLSNRGIIKGEKAQGVYLCQTTDRSKIKIGMTSNGYAREAQVKNGNLDAKIVYMKQTKNMRILEKLVHHILHEYRIVSTREWFAVSFEVAKCALDTAQLFMDGLVGKSASIVDHSFYEKLKDLITSLPNNPNAAVGNDEMDIECQDDENEMEVDIQPTKKYVDLDDDIRNPSDFARFIDECFVKGEDLTCFTAEVYGAHRLWARVNEKQAHDALHKYLCENFKKTRIYHPEAEALFASFRGIALKPLKYEKNDPPTDIDDFIEEKMKVGYCYRISIKEVTEAFTEWKQQYMPDYIMTPADKKRIDHEFSVKFLRSTVFNGKCGVYGFFGITLKTSNSFVGMKTANKLKKPVIKIDMITKEVVGKFQSLTALAKTLRKNASNVSEHIRFQKPIGNFLYKYEQDV